VLDRPDRRDCQRAIFAPGPLRQPCAARAGPANQGGIKAPACSLIRPPSIDRLLSREKCVSLGTFDRAFPWLGRCVSNPSPLAPANGDFDLVPDATVLHELGAPLRLNSTMCGVDRASAASLPPQRPPGRTGGFRNGMGWLEGSAAATASMTSARRFRTIQVCPKDRLTFPPAG
jgi:hypothetical protein